MLNLWLLAAIMAIQLQGSISNTVPADYDDSLSEDEGLWSEEETKSVDTTTVATIVDPKKIPPNEFVDFILDTLRTLLEIGGNKIPLPTKFHSVEQQILGITFRAHAKFYEGKVQGLQSIRRSGEASIDKYCFGCTRWVFDTELKDVEFNYGFNFEVMGFGPLGHIKGTLKSITIGLKLKMSRNGGLSIQDLDFKDIKDFTVRTSGLENYNYIVDGIGNAIGKVGIEILLESLKDKLKEVMNEALARVSVGS